ncbi:hypothetical protein ZIOFF_062926 [Zingiber officinale]|uniref:Uncharacterized protein n=1 Tax=Zingiber officinale TaxID=94328 RepID=A0A8J5F2Z7_ZINOF|nr:hypothetical protein ZIOFF_062926 [Zingiber officinale]
MDCRVCDIPNLVSTTLLDSSSFLYCDVVVDPDNIFIDDITVPDILDVAGIIDDDGSVGETQESLPMTILPPFEPVEPAILLSDDGSDAESLILFLFSFGSESPPPSSCAADAGPPSTTSGQQAPRRSALLVAPPLAARAARALLLARRRRLSALLLRTVRSPLSPSTDTGRTFQQHRTAATSCCPRACRARVPPLAAAAGGLYSRLSLTAERSFR